ncbi:hypothetical protein LJR225_001651 [Phenylobacterium sp. LjRoot225]|uniref:hypothetical protein n=1 Tax=Phenylobacterium sp. LjRoot225 TaxID=3342285 RepID=UPI003ECF7AE5
MRSRFGLLALVGAALSPEAAAAQPAGPDYEASMKAALVIMSVERLADSCRADGGFSAAERSEVDAWATRNRIEAFRPKMSELQNDRVSGPQLTKNVDLLIGQIGAAGVRPCRAAVTLIRSESGMLAIPPSALGGRRAPARAEAARTTPPRPAGASGTAVALARQIDSFGFDTRAAMGIGGFITTDIYPVVLMRDGAALKDVEGLSYPGGPAAHRAAHPQDWTRWRRAGGKIELLKSKGWQALPFSRTYAKLPAGFRLDGLYRRLSGGGNLAVGGSESVSAVSEYRFWSDGVVLRGGSVGSTAAAGTTSVVTRAVRPQERGSYSVDGLALRIRWDDGGEETRILVTDPADPKSVIWLDGRSYVRRKG